MFTSFEEVNEAERTKELPKDHLEINVFSAYMKGLMLVMPSIIKDKYEINIDNRSRIIDDIISTYKNLVKVIYDGKEYRNFLNDKDSDREYAYYEEVFTINELDKNDYETISEKLIAILKNLSTCSNLLSLDDINKFKFEFQDYIKNGYDDIISWSNFRKAWKIHTLLEVAERISLLSTCRGTAVGAVLTDYDFSIIASGFNGNPSGFSHCDTSYATEEELHDQSTELHAEANCIARASVSRFVALTNLFCTHLPCWECAKTIIASKARLNITNIFVRRIYSSKKQGGHTAEQVIGYLNKAGINVFIVPNCQSSNQNLQN